MVESCWICLYLSNGKALGRKDHWIRKCCPVCSKCRNVLWQNPKAKKCKHCGSEELITHYLVHKAPLTFNPRKLIPVF